MEEDIKLAHIREAGASKRLLEGPIAIDPCQSYYLINVFIIFKFII